MLKSLTYYRTLLCHPQNQNLYFRKLGLNYNAKINRKEMGKVTVRSTMQTLLNDKCYEVQRVKDHNRVVVDVIPVTEQSPCVLVTFGNITYYINPVAGFYEALLSIGKVPVMNSILFTRFNWKVALSLIPSLLNHQHLNVATLDLFGPQGMREIFASMMPLISSVKAWEMWQTRLLFHENCQPGIVTISTNLADVKMISHHSQYANSVLGYIFQSRQVRNLSQTQSINNFVSTWQDFPSMQSYMSYLKQSLDSCDSSTATSADSAESNLPNFSLCVFDCCDEKLLDEILCDKDLLNSLSEVSICIHLTSKSFFYSNAYSKLTRKLSSCQHISVHDLIHCCMIPNILQCYRALLHAVHPSFFPLHNNKYSLDILQKQLDGGSELHYTMMPINHSRVHLKLNFGSKNIGKIVQRLHKATNLTYLKQFSSCNLFPHLVVLGSGSSNISHSRAHPCYFFRISHNSSIMIDCGPGSLSQAMNHYGVHLAKSVFASLSCVVLTHKHSDHWCGFIDFLTELNGYRRNNNLIVFLPEKIKKYFLQTFDRRFFHTVTFVAFEDFSKSISSEYQTIAKKLNLKSLEFVRVSHGPPTYGVIMELLDGRKIVYSSDTLPLCERLIQCGINANLLIHDCLYINKADEEMATFRMHSTLAGAIATARQMNAKNVLLTHFGSSSRFLPFDTRTSNFEYDGNVLVAFDHLELPLNKVDDYVEFLGNLSNIVEEDHEKCNVIYESHKIHELVDVYEKVKSTTCV